MKKPEHPKKYVDTRFGRARWHITPDGKLNLSWEENVTINGVDYCPPWISPHRNYPEIHLQPKDFTRKATAAARTALEREHKRLSEQLLTPAALKEAQLRRLEWETWNAWCNMKRAEEDLAQATDTFETHKEALQAAAPERARGLFETPAPKNMTEMSLEELLQVDQPVSQAP